jgi:hypothetical protein
MAQLDPDLRRLVDELYPAVKVGDIAVALKPRQQFAVQRMTQYCNQKAILLMHEVGTGKTITSLAIALNSVDYEIRDANRIIVVAPTGIFENFRNDIDGIFRSSGVVHGIPVNLQHAVPENERGVGSDQYFQAKLFNANGPVVHFHGFSYKTFHALYQSNTDILKQGLGVLQGKLENAVVIFDEAHRLLRNVSNDKGTSFVKAYGVNNPFIGVKKLIFMTGTPYNNKFEDIFYFLKLLEQISPPPDRNFVFSDKNRYETHDSRDHAMLSFCSFFINAINKVPGINKLYKNVKKIPAYINQKYTDFIKGRTSLLNIGASSFTMEYSKDETQFEEYLKSWLDINRPHAPIGDQPAIQFPRHEEMKRIQENIIKGEKKMDLIKYGAIASVSVAAGILAKSTLTRYGFGGAAALGAVAFIASMNRQAPFQRIQAGGGKKQRGRDPEEDYLKVLGLNKEAVLKLNKEDSWKIITKAYRNLIREHHPNRGGDPEKSKEIINAYNKLECIYTEKGKDCEQDQTSNSSSNFDQNNIGIDEDEFITTFSQITREVMDNDRDIESFITFIFSIITSNEFVDYCKRFEDEIITFLENVAPTKQDTINFMYTITDEFKTYTAPKCKTEYSLLKEVTNMIEKLPTINSVSLPFPIINYSPTNIDLYNPDKNIQENTTPSITYDININKMILNYIDKKHENDYYTRSGENQTNNTSNILSGYQTVLQSRLYKKDKDNSLISDSIETMENADKKGLLLKITSLIETVDYVTNKPSNKISTLTDIKPWLAIINNNCVGLATTFSGLPFFAKFLTYEVIKNIIKTPHTSIIRNRSNIRQVGGQDRYEKGTLSYTLYKHYLASLGFDITNLIRSNEFFENARKYISFYNNKMKEITPFFGKTIHYNGNKAILPGYQNLSLEHFQTKIGEGKILLNEVTQYRYPQKQVRFHYSIYTQTQKIFYNLINIVQGLKEDDIHIIRSMPWYVYDNMEQKYYISKGLNKGIQESDPRNYISRSIGNVCDINNSYLPVYDIAADNYVLKKVMVNPDGTRGFVDLEDNDNNNLTDIQKFSCPKFVMILTQIILMKCGIIYDNEKGIQHHPHYYNNERVDRVDRIPDEIPNVDYRDATHYFLPFVYSISEFMGLNNFGMFLQKLGLTYIIDHDKDTNDRRNDKRRRELRTAYKLFDKETRIEIIKRIIENMPKIYAANQESYAILYDIVNIITRDRVHNQQPLCILLHPDKTEGIDGRFNPAIILMEPPNTYGDYDQLCGRVLRTYKNTFQIPPQKYILQFSTVNQENLEQIVNQRFTDIHNYEQITGEYRFFKENGDIQPSIMSTLRAQQLKSIDFAPTNLLSIGNNKGRGMIKVQTGVVQGRNQLTQGTQYFRRSDQPRNQPANNAITLYKSVTRVLHPESMFPSLRAFYDRFSKTHLPWFIPRGKDIITVIFKVNPYVAVSAYNIQQQNIDNMTRIYQKMLNPYRNDGNRTSKQMEELEYKVGEMKKELARSPVRNNERKSLTFEDLRKQLIINDVMNTSPELLWMNNILNQQYLVEQFIDKVNKYEFSVNERGETIHKILDIDESMNCAGEGDLKKYIMCDPLLKYQNRAHQYRCALPVERMRDGIQVIDPVVRCPIVGRPIEYTEGDYGQNLVSYRNLARKYMDYTQFYNEDGTPRRNPDGRHVCNLERDPGAPGNAPGGPGNGPGAPGGQDGPGGIARRLRERRQAEAQAQAEAQRQGGYRKTRKGSHRSSKHQTYKRNKRRIQKKKITRRYKNRRFTKIHRATKRRHS